MYCRVIFFMGCFLACLLSIGQSTGNVKKGDAWMRKGNYTQAAAFYKKAADGNINDVVAKEKLGKALLESGDLQSAEAVYQLLATSPMAADINKFHYAQVLCMNGKYEVAKQFYQAYFEEHPNDPLAAEFKDFYSKLQALQVDHKVYQLTNIPENSAGSDVAPTFCLYDFCFSSNGHGSRKGTFDLYMLQAGNKSNPANPQTLKGNINQRLDEGAATFTRDGKEMIFTRSNYGHKSKDGVMKLGLYHADYSAESHSWTNITPLPFNDHNYNFMQPSVSKDGNRLFFSSDMPGGLGETDIYVCNRQGNSWSAPVNLGAGVNTVGKDESPFIADDGTLYFSSDSRLGLGGLDIYAATLTDTSWGHVVNPGAPLNSGRDDFGYISDSVGRSGYIVSNRPGGNGGNDIYHFSMNSTSACGILVDAKTQKLVAGAAITLLSNDAMQHETKSSDGGDFCFENAGDAQIEVNQPGYERYHGNLSGGGARQIIMLQPKEGIDFLVHVAQKGTYKTAGATALLLNTTAGSSSEQKSDSDGNVKFALQPNQEYVLKISKTDVERGDYEKFVRPISTIGLKAGQTISEDAQLIYHEVKTTAGVSATKGVAVPFSGELPVIYFDLGSSALSGAAKKELNKIAGLMKTEPEMQLEISSNTDATGSMHANMILSAHRALACLNYLSEHGISKSRFIAVGYGDRKPVNNCARVNNCSEAERAMNRRTEFKIIKQ